MLNWKDIFMCPLGTFLDDRVAYLARSNGYKYFCHNDRIYVLAEFRDTGLTASEIEGDRY